MEKLKVKKLNNSAKLPTRAHKFDAGLDLYAAETVECGQVTKVSTGIAVSIPEGYVGLICDRSSMAAKGFKVAGGVIDHGYNGDVAVVLHCTVARIHRLETAGYSPGLGPLTIKAGDKIAQLLVVPIATPEAEEVDSLKDSDRGNNGFGSTGS